MHFKITKVDRIALNCFFKTFFLHVFKVCDKEVFHFRKLKDLKNCLFAKTYAPLFLEIILNRTWWRKKTVVAGYFLFLHPCLNALEKSSAQKLHFSPKNWDSRLQFKPMFDHVEGKNWEDWNLINGLWNSFLQCYRIFPPRVQTSFNSNSKTFLRSHKFRIILKTFLTNIAALSKNVENMKGDD